MFLLCKEENETPGWTQLKLPGQAPSPRCGHTITSGGHYVITFTSVPTLLAIYLHAAIGYFSALIFMYVLILHGMYFEWYNSWGCLCCYTMQSCLCSKSIKQKMLADPGSWVAQIRVHLQVDISLGNMFLNF